MKYALFWSGGKDSLLALDRAKHAGLNICCLVNIYEGSSGRVRFHGVRLLPLPWDHLFSRSSGNHTVQGDTWTWHSESKIKGKVVHWPGTYKEVPPDTATMKFEMQGDDGKWNAVMEEKFSRVK